MHQCKLTGATLVIAKLDRLSRNAHFLLGLQASGVEFMCADMPEANKLTIGLLAIVAQHEREQISARTKAALAAAKARNVVLGGFRGVMPPSAAVATAARVVRYDAYAARVQPVIREMQDQGMSLRQIAAEMAARGIETPRGWAWTADAVRRALARVSA